ncbi:hypothetical protein K466DRAFT_332289 [Polyporus arcularius HHB13444]|uniref:Uncharacterized protein n=1 Tax=Polyporus arcularius HHB13444 TaxID=1314778 RepID=A0A5C3PSB7_9APHY|nr:hypothetical protein K466DRAFT_332289 [Polyporus arcularius HHB13444]
MNALQCGAVLRTRPSASASSCSGGMPTLLVEKGCKIVASFRASIVAGHRMPVERISEDRLPVDDHRRKLTALSRTSSQYYHGPRSPPASPGVLERHPDPLHEPLPWSSTAQRAPKGSQYMFLMTPTQSRRRNAGTTRSLRLV